MTPSRELLLARHAETDWNAEGRWQGQTDVPLNDAGRAQARALAERLRGVGVAAVATSDLLRARVTAEIVAEALGLRVGLVDPDLREQRYGRFEGLTFGECARAVPEAWASHAADPRATPPGGESREEVAARVLPAIHRVTERLPAPALVVMHGGALRALLARAVAGGDARAGSWPPGPIPNGAVFRLRLLAGGAMEAAWLDAR